MPSEHTAGQRVYRLVSQASPVVYCREVNEKAFLAIYRIV